MPTSDRVARLAPTTSRVHLLLEVAFAGFVHRVADEVVSVEHEDGSVLVFGDGLALDYEATMAVLADAGGEVAVPVAVVLPGVDVAELVAAGHDLAAGTASLSRWVEGTTYGKRQVLVEGAVSDPRYGAEGEELSFSIATLPINDTALWPDATAVVNSETWPSAHENAVGAVYPQILGCPGWVDAGSDSRRVPGSRALLVNQSGDIWLIAGHPVRSTRVWWRDLNDDVDGWNLADVNHTTDGLGRRVAYITNIATDLADDAEWDVWISWAPIAGGRLRVPPKANLQDDETFTISDGTTSYVFKFQVTGGATIGAGEVEVNVQALTTDVAVRDAMAAAINGVGSTLIARPGLLPSNGVVVDLEVENSRPGSVANVPISETVTSGTFAIAFGMVGGLDENERGGLTGHGYGIEGAGDMLEYVLQRSSVPVDVRAMGAARQQLNAMARCAAWVGEQVSPLEWARTHLLEVLPVSLLMSSAGIRPLIWDQRRVTAAENTTTIDADDLDVERLGPVEVGSPDDVVNAITVRWGLDASTNDTFLMSTTVSGTPGATGNAACRASRARYGERTVEPIDSEVLYDAASVANVCAWMTAAKAWVSVRVSYAAPRERFLHLLPGDVVVLSDSELHWTTKPFFLVGVRDEGGPDLELTLQSIEQPGWT